MSPVRIKGTVWIKQFYKTWTICEDGVDQMLLNQILEKQKYKSLSP